MSRTRVHRWQLFAGAIVLMSLALFAVVVLSTRGPSQPRPERQIAVDNELLTQKSDPIVQDRLNDWLSTKVQFQRELESAEALLVDLREREFAARTVSYEGGEGAEFRETMEKKFVAEAIPLNERIKESRRKLDAISTSCDSGKTISENFDSQEALRLMDIMERLGMKEDRYGMNHLPSADSEYIRSFIAQGRQVPDQLRFRAH